MSRTQATRAVIPFAPVAPTAPTAWTAPLPGAPAPQPEPAAAQPDRSDLRLVIEEDGDSGAFVYKTVNRRTGEVISQIPRAEVLKLKDDAYYLAGTVFDGRS